MCVRMCIQDDLRVHSFSKSFENAKQKLRTHTPVCVRTCMCACSCVCERVSRADGDPTKDTCSHVCMCVHVSVCICALMRVRARTRSRRRLKESDFAPRVQPPQTRLRLCAKHRQVEPAIKELRTSSAPPQRPSLAALQPWTHRLEHPVGGSAGDCALHPHSATLNPDACALPLSPMT